VAPSCVRFPSMGISEAVRILSDGARHVFSRGWPIAAGPFFCLREYNTNACNPETEGDVATQTERGNAAQGAFLRLVPGVALALGVVLRGSKLNFFDVMKLGGLSAALVVVVIAVALTVSTRIARLLKLEEKLGALIAVGCTICGGSAIAATAPALDAHQKDVAFAVGASPIMR